MKKYGIGVIGENSIAKNTIEQIQKREQDLFNIHFVAGVSTQVNVENKIHTADEIIEADTIDIVVITLEQVMKAYDHARKALELGKHVVTNNATMLAAHGEKLWRLAQDKNVHLKFEATSLGAVPIFENLFTHFSGQNINKIYGSLNTTCNYALMRMKDKGDSLIDALSDAVELGYAEKDPNVDLSGKDSLFKMALLHTAAYGEWVDVGSQKVQGLEGLDQVDIKLCQKLALSIKLLASTNGQNITVSPTLFEESSQIGNTTGTLNGVVIETEEASSVFFCGHAADKEAIASSIVSDCLKISQGQKPWVLNKPNLKEPKIEKNAQYYIRVNESDNSIVTKANHLHIIEEQILTTQNGSFIAYLVETGMPKPELINFLMHSAFKEDHFLMNVYKG